MQTLGNLLAREQRSDDAAVRDDREGVGGDGSDPNSGPSVAYTYRDFLTTAWKTANFFRTRGVHEGATVAVLDDAAAPPLLSFLGAAQIGALTRFAPPDDVAADLLVGPGERVLQYDLPPGATRVAYTAGSNVDDPTVRAFGRNVWSENPVEPPETVDPSTPAVWTPDGGLTHSEVLGRAATTAGDLTRDDEVVVRAPLELPGTIVAGVIAPLMAGATVVVPDAETVGDVAISTAEAPEPRVCSPADELSEA